MPKNNNRLERGDIVIAADRRSEFGSKPRPVVIIQRSDAVARLATVTVCLLTSQPSEAPLVRVPVAATAETGLDIPSWAMIERLTTISQARLGRRIGHVDDATMLAISRALLTFLGVT